MNDRIVRIWANIPWLSDCVSGSRERMTGELTPVDQSTERRKKRDSECLLAAQQSAPSDFTASKLCSLGREALTGSSASHDERRIREELVNRCRIGAPSRGEEIKARNPAEEGDKKY